MHRLPTEGVRFLRAFMYARSMKLIVGIGNPDPTYAQTRHNVGWLYLDWLNKKYGNGFEPNKGVEGEIAKANIEEFPTWLLKPHTYVNASGRAVAKAKLWTKAKPTDIVVIQDDLDVPFGSCKLSFDKNSGGHRGIESIVNTLKTKKFYRIKIGLGTRGLKKARQGTTAERDAWIKHFVLKSFTPTEREKLKEVFKECHVRLMQAFKQ